MIARSRVAARTSNALEVPVVCVAPIDHRIRQNVGPSVPNSGQFGSGEKELVWDST